MPRYRWTAPETTPAQIAELGIEVEPGQEFDSEIELNHPYAEPVRPKKSTPPPQE